MSEGELRILFVEDSADDLELSVRELRRYGMVFDYRCVDSEWGLMAELESYRPDIVLCDFVMPGFSGRTALQIVRQRAPFLPFCFLSGRIGEVSAIESIKEGATDYILKQNLSRLPVAVERALKEAAALRQQRRIDEELRLRSGALDAAANSIVITDREGVIRWVNRSFTILTGYSFEEAIGQTPRLLKSGVQGEAYYSDLWQTIISGNVWHGELVNRKKDGSTYFEEETITPVRDPSGVITHFVAVKQEITERKEQERRIRRLNRIYELLSRINSLIIRVSDRQELFDESCIIGVESGGFDIAIVDTYDSASDVFATVSSYGVNREHVELLCQEGVGHINQRGGLISRAILEKKTVFSNDITSERVQESPRRRISRELGYRSLVVLPLLLDSTVVATLSLISREKGFLDSEELKLLRELSADISFAISHIEKSARAEFLAFYNPVTELPNRRLLIERLRLNMTDSSRRCAVVLIDVERFRNVNLSLGRSVGDSLLVQIAARLGKIHNDQIIVAHTERDHFIVAFGDIQDISEIAHFVEAVLLMTFGEPYMVDKEILHVASRAGVAIYPDDAIDVEDLLRNADQALQRSKAHKQLYSFFSPEMNLRISESMRLENDLRIAISEEQFVLYYQPKYDLRTGQLSGVEALIRWQHPDRGFIMPGLFLPLLEETALIVPVGEWVIRTAAAQYRAWKEAGLQAPRIAVNVSPDQLSRKDFVPVLREILYSRDKTDHGIDIEITETIVMSNVQQNIGIFGELHELGVNISIDDFGTGYSSLSYIARLPIDILKIDRSFIRMMHESQPDLLIVSTILSLAHQLRLRVVAEGVEREIEADSLRRMGCDEAQGYLYCEPVPSEKITELLLPASR